MSLTDNLDEVRRHYCTGPCGQSQSVLARREKTDRVIKSAAAVVDRAVLLLQDAVAAWEENNLITQSDRTRRIYMALPLEWVLDASALIEEAEKDTPAKIPRKVK